MVRNNPSPEAGGLLLARYGIIYMSQLEAENQVVIPDDHYGNQMIDPISGLSIPKRLDLNLSWRKRIVMAAETSASTRRQLMTASSKSLLFWINAFAWTHRPKKVDADGKEITLLGSATHVPFVTWRVQDETLLGLLSAIGDGASQPHDVAIDKARDMGATWMCLATFMWYWRFRANTTFLVLSRKESLVDRRGSMDSLFEKMRYLLRWLPNWMQPNVRDTYMHMENKDNGAVIDGESANPNAGQASRSTATLLDEFARVPDGEAIDIGTTDTAACRIFNSTPGSPSSHYTRIIRSKRCKILPLPWWRHPEKGRGLYLAESHLLPSVLGKGAGLLKPEGKETWKWVSPWYVLENDRRKSLRNIAQNLDMEHGRVGDMVFDSESIEKHRATFARQPDMLGAIRYEVEVSDKTKKNFLRSILRGGSKTGFQSLYFSTNSGTVSWRLWLPLVDHVIEFFDADGKPASFTTQRPSQDTRYVFGVDISAGTGASNSVVTVSDKSTGQIVAKFWDAYTMPEALAELVMYAAAWFGGTDPPYIVFEKNGPGMQFGKKLIDFGYPSIYYQTDDSKKAKIRTKRWGWHSSNQKKELLVGEYRDALATGKIINPCNEALDEAIDYVFDDAGKLTPGHTGTDESSGATATHGDHVIADSLCQLGMSDLPSKHKELQHRDPHGSFAQRRKLFRQRKEEHAAWEG